MPGDLLSGPLARMWQVLNDNPRLRKLADMIVSAGNTAHEYLSSGEGADSKTPRVIDRTKQFVEAAEAGDDDGWFSFINLMDAHLPYHPPEEFGEEFAPGVDSTEVCQNSKLYNSGAREIDDDEWEEIRGLYDAEIAHIDSQLTRLFDWLKATDRWDDTAVVVCADHGELHGEHGLYGHEFGLYDPLVNVPLMVKHPEIEQGRRQETVELIDLYHTVLDTFDADAAATAADEEAVPLDRTRSLLADEYRAFDGVDDADPAQQAAPDGETGFIEYSRPVVELKQLEEKAADAGIDLDEDSRFYARMRAARRADAKYVRIDRIEDEAYRLDEDPDETENLAGVDDETIDDVEGELAIFENEIGGAWTSAAAGEITDDAVEGWTRRSRIGCRISGIWSDTSHGTRPAIGDGRSPGAVSVTV
ncbi:arylsulfatase [Halolamina pelagica]|uniref:Arylsulfatase n=1 Tax=Halolamina pelagica TaxID=699431 RepID=A0A0P7G926_9EURY|nr:arylsulfatase [Halolamina pelagica]